MLQQGLCAAICYFVCKNLQTRVLQTHLLISFLLGAVSCQRNSWPRLESCPLLQSFLLCSSQLISRSFIRRDLAKTLTRHLKRCKLRSGCYTYCSLHVLLDVADLQMSHLYVYLILPRCLRGHAASRPRKHALSFGVHLCHAGEDSVFYTHAISEVS